MKIIAAGYSEDSDYTSDVNFPVNGHFPNAPASQYLQVSISMIGKSNKKNQKAMNEKITNG